MEKDCGILDAGHVTPWRVAINSAANFEMNARIRTLLQAAFPLFALAARGEDSLSNASWIWSAHNDSIAHFRRVLALPSEIKSARITITADNGYELYFNGAFLGSDVGAASEVWQSAEAFDVRSLVKPGENVVAIRASDLGGEAGLLCAIEIEDKDGRPVRIVSDAKWKVSSSSDPTGFAEASYSEDATWETARVVGQNGIAPWGLLRSGRATPHVRGFREADSNFAFPTPLIVVRGRTAESSTPNSPQAVWRIGDSRAYLEIDTLGPSIAGYGLEILRLNAGGAYDRAAVFSAGLVGSPSVDHDGNIVYFSHVPAGEKFWRIGALQLANRSFKILTSGPFHDFDPEPLPDGRIVFSSTRIGNREEYHGNMARSLFVMNGDGSNVRAITHHIVADLEPRLTAEGNLAFIRQDNFMERAKVETHIHTVRPDGTAGAVLLGPDRGALGYDRATAAEENGLWLRNVGFGSPAPLPDGRVAALSSVGLVISGNAVRPKVALRPAMELIDISPLPDGRLLSTLGARSGIGVIDLEKNVITRIHSKSPLDSHSVVFAGARPKPAVARSSVEPARESVSQATGYLLGQNIFLTRQSKIDMSRVKAIRIIEGRPFATRSARHPYDHLGVEAIELGTAPVAPDGSFYVEVPADRALSIQAIDGEGRSVANELSWIYVRPGEQRSCVGCHSQPDAAPANSGGILALSRPPVRLLGRGSMPRWRGNNAANGGVLNLQFERMREAASINSHGASIEALIESLSGAESDLRASAAARLGLLRDHRAASNLERALTDASEEVRLAAATALGACGNSRSIKPLLIALTDDDPAVAQAAAVALRNFTANPTPFNGFARKDERLTLAAEWGERCDAAALERKLLARLTTNTTCAEDVFNALSHIGSSGAVGPIADELAVQMGKDLRAAIAGLRALGQIGSPEAIPFLAKTLRAFSSIKTNATGDHEFGWTQGPVQIAAAAAEALGRIGGARSEKLLLETFASLGDFWTYSFRTADHDWLMGCHSSPVHFRILEALHRIRSDKVAPVAGAILRSIPIDPDRALLFEKDAYETLAAALIAGSGAQEEITQACADILHGQKAKSNYASAVSASPPAVSVGPMEAEARAAQILSIVASPQDAALVRSVLLRFHSRPPSATRNWICFYMARALAISNDQETVDLLAGILAGGPTESAAGLLSPPNVFIYEAVTPFYRAAAADALGRIGAASAVPALIKTVAEFGNALDVRNAAAQALARLPCAESLPTIQSLAADYPEVSTRRLLLEAVDAGTAAARKKLAKAPCRARSFRKRDLAQEQFLEILSVAQAYMVRAPARVLEKRGGVRKKSHLRSKQRRVPNGNHSFWRDRYQSNARGALGLDVVAKRARDVDLPDRLNVSAQILQQCQKPCRGGRF